MSPRAARWTAVRAVLCVNAKTFALYRLTDNSPMPRQTQLLYPARPPAPARDAATVLLLRDGDQGMEVLMTRRSATASFVPGA